MSDLEKYITRGWYEIRTRLDKPDDLFDYLEIEKSDLSHLAEKLRLSVEGGVIEYKRSLLHSIMSSLGSLKYDSRAISDLSPQSAKSSYLTILPVLQRLIVLGLLKVPAAEKTEKEEAPGTQGTHTNKASGAPSSRRGTAAGANAQNTSDTSAAGSRPSIKDMIAEVRSFTKEHPDIQNNPEIKRIFLQLKNYNNELEKKKSLEPNIPKEKKPSFEDNFRQIFEEIHEKIYHAYRTFLSQQEQNEQPQSNLPILKRYDFSSCEDIYRNQAEEASRLYHTLDFVRKERYQMREILLEIASAEPYYEENFKKELECYKKIAPFSGDDIHASLAFAEHLRRYSERSIEWRPK